MIGKKVRKTNFNYRFIRKVGFLEIKYAVPHVQILVIVSPVECIFRRSVARSC